MKYSAIIFDLDGTAMPGTIDGMPSEKVVAVTSRYADSVNLCAATGRSWHDAKAVVRALGLTKPCILSGGAVIINPVTEEILWQETIPVATAQAVLSVASKFPYKLTYARNLLVTEPADPHSIEITAPVNAMYMSDMSKGAEDEVMHALETIGGITVSKAYSWFIKDGRDLHVTNQQATKEHAVAELCRILGVESQNVAGIGDGFNDLHLFTAVGHKVAMGNAAPELKAEADEIIGSLSEDGLADFISNSISDI